MKMLTEVTAKWKLKKAYNPFISKHNTHDLYDLYFRKGVLNTNEHSQCEGQKLWRVDDVKISTTKLNGVLPK